MEARDMHVYMQLKERQICQEYFRKYHSSLYFADTNGLIKLTWINPEMDV